MKPKPIYTITTITDGFVLHRDAMPLKTPAGAPLVLPIMALAQRIAEEWRAQGDKLKPETMPLTQLAMTALDIIAPKKDSIVASVAAYGASDLLCHRAEEPPDLAEQQAKLWQPWLDWAEKKYGAGLKVGTGVMPITQPVEALAKLRQAVAAYDTLHLAGLQEAVGVSGSLILGLALAEGDAMADTLFNATELDALYQAAKWGEDPVTVERHKSVQRDLDVCAKWFGLLAV